MQHSFPLLISRCERTVILETQQREKSNLVHKSNRSGQNSPLTQKRQLHWKRGSQIKISFQLFTHGTDTSMYDAGHAILLEHRELVRCENMYTRDNKIERQDIILFTQYFFFIVTDRLRNQAYHANVFTVRETHSIPFFHCGQFSVHSDHLQTISCRYTFLFFIFIFFF